MSIDGVMAVIDDATAPVIMSKAEALDFLDEIRDQLQSRMELSVNLSMAIRAAIDSVQKTPRLTVVVDNTRAALASAGE